VLSLLVVVAIVGVLAKKQMSAVTAPLPSVPGAPAAAPAATPQQQVQQYQQAVQGAMQQARPVSDEAK
jgi:hypothetical protein